MIGKLSKELREAKKERLELKRKLLTNYVNKTDEITDDVKQEIIEKIKNKSDDQFIF